MTWELSSYFFTEDRHWEGLLLDYGIETFEVDFQLGKRMGRHDLLAGVRYRHHDFGLITGNLPIAYTAVLGTAALPLFTSRSGTGHEVINSAFLQDTIQLRDDLHLLIGTKFEDGTTGDDWMPSARIWWTPDGKTTYWASYSIANQSPAYNSMYVDTNVGYTPVPPTFTTFLPLSIVANPESQPATLKQWEAGWRHLANDNLSLNLAAFFGDFEDLTLAGEHGIGMNHHNVDSAESYGAEFGVNWHTLGDALAVRASASYSDTDISGPGASTNQYSSAKWRGNLLANYTPNADYTYHLGVYATERAFEQVPGYIRTDIGCTWHPHDQGWEATLRVQNLFDPSHPEDYSSFYGAYSREIPRTTYLQIRRWFSDQRKSCTPPNRET